MARDNQKKPYRQAVLMLSVALALCECSGAQQGSNHAPPPRQPTQIEQHCKEHPVQGYLFGLIENLNQTVEYKNVIKRNVEYCAAGDATIAQVFAANLKACLSKSTELDPDAMSTINGLVNSASEHAERYLANAVRAYDRCATNVISCGSPECCGDSQQQPGEQCDAGSNNGRYGAPCNAGCSGPGPHCGDAHIDLEEECDGGPRCTTDCTICGEWHRKACADGTCADGLARSAELSRCWITGEPQLQGTPDDRLWKAIEIGNLRELRLALQESADFRSSLKWARPLTFAASRKANQMVQDLISFGADPNVYDNARTVLYVAVKEQSVDLVRTLCRKGANAALKELDRETPILHLAAAELPEAISELTRCGAEPNANEAPPQTDEAWTDWERGRAL